MEVYGLFPTPMGVFNLDRDLTFNEKELVLNLPVKLNTSNKISNDFYVLNNKEMLNLKHFININLNEYFQSVYQPTNNVSLRITQSWCNFSNYGESHHTHSHSNSLISGVFYIQCNENDLINFYRHSSNILLINAKHSNKFNSSTWSFPVKTGTLLLFPSELKHGVDKIMGDKTRISLSFNSFPVGTIGDYVSANELILT